MTRLRKLEMDQVPEEEAAVIASAIASYMGTSKFMIRSVEPLDGDVAPFGVANTESKTSVEQRSFSTWRPKK